MSLRINLERLKKDLLALSEFGRDKKGGITRPSFSQADLEARAWLKERIEEAGLSFRQDGAGNIFGRLEGKGKTVMVGSHHDTVVNGGMFDGATGVLAGLECLRRIKEEGVEVSRPIEVASFTDEEGNLVGDFLGSRAFVGLLKREELEKGITSIGVPFSEILERTEFSLESILKAHRQRPELEAYLELHIEQGALLETEDKPIGIVDVIAGKHYRRCAFLGKADHGGTTPLELRQDAFLGTADFALRSIQLVATKYYGSVVTIGQVRLSPGGFNIVPAEADFTFEFRSTSRETLRELENVLFSLAENIASTRGLRFVSEVVDHVDPVELAPGIKKLMKEECEKLGYPYMNLPSGAGHDAQIVANVAQAGMIFIPSVDGASHSPQEKITWEDLEKGANLLLQTVLRLARLNY
ncbi:MAG: Zn-dependent hydrolase [Candidatus Aminicenantales bacterium]